MRKVFLEGLPRKYGLGANKDRLVIDLIKSVKHIIKFVYDDIEGKIEIVDYDPKESYLYIKYEDKEIYKIKAASFQKCKLGKLLGKYTDEFKINIGENFKDNKRDITIIDRKIEKDVNNKNWKYYKYKCNKCGYSEGWMVERSILIGIGCACCGDQPKVVVEGINDIPTTAPWMVKFFQGCYEEAKMYTRSSGLKIKPVCPDCGRIKNKEISIYNIYKEKSIWCYCSDGQSYPNKFIFNLFEQLKIDFQTEYCPKWIGQNRYDFYFKLDNNKYIVEAHGEQHYIQTARKGARSLEEEQENDKFKKELALNNGIKEENYIVIDCRESELKWIKDHVLDSRLSELFDLSKIDWLRCEEFALSNLVKIACDHKRDNPEITTKDIGKLMKLDVSTIRTYLKKGTELGWCQYNPKKEYLKALKKLGKNGNKVEIFKDGVSLGVFDSYRDLERQSEKLFGVKLLKYDISLVCRGKRSYYKGFTFKPL